MTPEQAAETLTADLRRVRARFDLARFSFQADLKQIALDDAFEVCLKVCEFNRQYPELAIAPLLPGVQATDGAQLPSYGVVLSKGN
jgi:hypothetical protein